MNVDFHTLLIDAVVESAGNLHEALCEGTLVLIIDWNMEEGVDAS